MRTNRFAAFACVVACAFLALTWPSANASSSSTAGSGGFNSGSDGSDGPLNVTVDRIIDLAVEGSYDAAIPAVIFDYTTVTVNQNRTLTFKNHPSRCPVIWRVQGDVTINGTVSLDGQTGNLIGYAEPGPGGFRGGKSGQGSSASAGFGWGGGGKVTSGNPVAATHATPPSQATTGQIGPTYGSPTAFPLIGGSGGGGSDSDSFAGGGGGGAILIAANGIVTVASPGNLRANGGSAPCCPRSVGAGGTIRILADRIDVIGAVQAVSGNGVSDTGGRGRVRLEANTYVMLSQAVPPASVSQAGPGLVLPPVNAPRVAVVSVSNLNESQTVPADPRANVAQGDVALSFAGGATVHLKATNVPVGKVCQVKVTNTLGDFVLYNSTPLNQSLEATAAVVLPNGICTIVARIDLTQP